MTKAPQNTDDPRMTTIRTNSEAANASCTSECQSKNHRVPKADPTAAPTMTWFSVWRRWDTRNHDCTQIRLELACSQWHKTTAWCYENGNIHDMIEHGGASRNTSLDKTGRLRHGITYNNNNNIAFFPKQVGVGTWYNLLGHYSYQIGGHWQSCRPKNHSQIICPNPVIYCILKGNRWIKHYGMLEKKGIWYVLIMEK